MWIIGGTIYLVMLTAIFFVWVSKEEQKEKARLAALEPVPVSSI